MNNRLYKSSSITAILTTMLMALLAASCQKDDPSTPIKKNPYTSVMIFYGCAQNNLDLYMKEDIEDMVGSEDSYVPSKSDDRALVICYHGAKKLFSYKESGPTYTIWIYRDPESGSIIRDTIARAEYTTTADAEVMRELLSNVKSKFDSERYGIVFSSHGTGWLPQGSYEEGSESENIFSLSASRVQADADTSAGKRLQRQPYSSFGQERVGSTDYYMDITDMAAAMPMKMDYILFDACLMGCVEVAYELCGVADIIGFPQSELMSDGFYYPTMTRRLLLEGDPRTLIEETFNFYEVDSDCVISCVDCRKMAPLAECCRKLTSAYSDKILSLDKEDLQRFYRGNHPWFFDLQDIYEKCGITEGEKAELQAALDECVMYKAHTDHIPFDWTMTVTRNCGFSMYLPQYGTESMNDFYKTLAWYKAVGLAE